MQNRAKIDGIKILLVGDVPDVHLVLRAICFKSTPAIFKLFKIQYFLYGAVRQGVLGIHEKQVQAHS